MMVSRRLLVLGLMILACAMAAHANMYAPSLAEMIAAPSYNSVLLFTMVITVPVLGVIALIEALVLRRRQVEGHFGQLLWALFFVNFLTGLLRLPQQHDDAQRWALFALAFVLTVPAEALLIWWRLKRLLGPMRFRTALRLSAGMNTASYAVLGVVLASLLYVPSIGHEDAALRARLTGRIVAGSDMDGTRVIDMPTCQVSVKATRSVSSRMDFMAQVSGPTEAKLVDRSGGRLTMRLLADSIDLTVEGGYLSGEDVPIPSPDGRFSLRQPGKGKPWEVRDRKAGRTFALSGVVVDYLYDVTFSSSGRHLAIEGFLTDLTTGQTHALPRGSGNAAFSHDGTRLAWSSGYKAIAIMDIATSVVREMPVPNIVTNGRIAWSPDGAYIAYPGTVNPYTYDRWYPDVRVLEISTGHTVTVNRRVFTCGRWCDLLWLSG